MLISHLSGEIHKKLNGVYIVGNGPSCEIYGFYGNINQLQRSIFYFILNYAINKEAGLSTNDPKDWPLTYLYDIKWQICILK